MKQLLILSGKGGTGKTTVASAFIKLAQAQAYADCDVDAPNLHLVMNSSTMPAKTDYFGMPKAVIDSNLCTRCNTCVTHCRFEAIISSNGTYTVDPFGCEGCGLCEALCPTGAAVLKPAVSGELTLYADKKSVFSTAQLKMGSGTSGKLVSEVKKQLRDNAKNAPLAIVDGSPGIGCPVIASLSGVDLVLIVTEPSISGISDMRRIIKTAAKFGLKTAVCINKYTTNLENTDKIVLFCKEENITFIGKIPFDPQAVKAVNAGQTIADFDCTSGQAVKEIFDNCMQLLYKGKPHE